MTWQKLRCAVLTREEWFRPIIIRHNVTLLMSYHARFLKKNLITCRTLMHLYCFQRIIINYWINWDKYGRKSRYRSRMFCEFVLLQLINIDKLLITEIARNGYSDTSVTGTMGIKVSLTWKCHGAEITVVNWFRLATIGHSRVLNCRIVRPHV